MIERIWDKAHKKIFGPTPAKTKSISSIVSKKYTVSIHDGKVCEFSGDRLARCNSGQHQLVTCTPIPFDTLKSLSEDYMAPSRNSYARRGKIYFNKEQFVAAYDSSYKTHDEDAHHNTFAYHYDYDDSVNLSDLLIKDDGGHVLKSVIPPLTKIRITDTNIPHTYYVEYDGHLTNSIPHRDWDWQCYSQSALLTDDVLFRACVPANVTTLFPFSLLFQGPKVNFMWKKEGYGGGYYYGNGFKITTMLLSIFMFGEPDAVRAFAPGIMNVMHDFFATISTLESDNYRLAKMEDSIAQFLGDLCGTLYASDWYQHINISQPLEYITKEMDEAAKAAAEKALAEKHKDECLDKFRESINARRNLLKDFNSIPVITAQNGKTES